MPILTPDRRIRIFISSTLGELAAERTAARTAVEQLRQQPVVFEEGARPCPPQEVYRQLLEQSDVFVGIYWQSYGWIAKGMNISGIEDEYNRSADKPRLIYIKSTTTPRDPRLDALIGRIRDANDAVYKAFDSPQQLQELVANDLGQIFAEQFAQLGGGARLARRNKLPNSSTSFIGRQLTIERIAARISENSVRLLTLTGPGGVGKTRVALEVGRSIEDRFAGGACFVDLMSVTEPSQVLSTILNELGVSEDPSRSPHDQLCQYLDGNDLLLILDNFEHLVAAAPDIAAVLDETSHGKILATSRVLLQISWEREFAIDPLDLSSLDPVPPINVAAENEAVALFIQRAREINTSISLSHENLEAVVTICIRLDGLPLALELAAARVRLISIHGILNGLEDRFRLLVGGPHDAPPHQRTLLATIDWSYDLLGPSEQACLRSLGVFAGGGRLDTIGAVVPAIVEGSLLDDLECLLRASLLATRMDPDGEPRFVMLESIRAYALELLGQNGELEAAWRNLAGRMSGLTLELAIENIGIPRPSWMNRLEAEYTNIVAALLWCQERDERSLLVRIVWNMWRFWNVRGYVREGRIWLKTAIEWANAEDVHIRTDLMAGEAQLARRQRDYSTAEGWLEEVLDIWRDLGEVRPQAEVLLQLAALEHDQENHGEARIDLEKAERIYRKLDDRLGIARVTVGLGGLAVEEYDYESASPLLAEASQILRELGPDGDEASLVSCLSDLARVSQAAGRWEEAAGYLEEVLAIQDSIKDTRGKTTGLISLARTVQRLGDQERAARLRTSSAELAEQLGDPVAYSRARFEQARYETSRSESERLEYLCESLYTFGFFGDSRGTAECFEAMAYIRTSREPEAATELFAAAWRVRKRSGFPIHPNDEAVRDNHIELLRAMLGDIPFETAWENGVANTAEGIYQKHCNGHE